MQKNKSSPPFSIQSFWSKYCTWYCLATNIANRGVGEYITLGHKVKNCLSQLVVGAYDAKWTYEKIKQIFLSTFSSRLLIKNPFGKRNQTSRNDWSNPRVFAGSINYTVITFIALHKSHGSSHKVNSFHIYSQRIWVHNTTKWLSFTIEGGLVNKHFNCRSLLQFKKR